MVPAGEFQQPANAGGHAFADELLAPPVARYFRRMTDCLNVGRQSRERVSHRTFPCSNHAENPSLDGLA
jgi:hypothetical protein